MAGQLQVSFSPILVILLVIFVALFAIYVYQNGVVADVAMKSEGMSEEFREGAGCSPGKSKKRVNGSIVCR
jgi:hypothetical protein